MWKRSAVVFVSLFVSACGGNNGDGSDPTTAPLTLAPIHMCLVERILEVQLPNGAFDFSQLTTDDPVMPGYQNVTGITALGLVDAYVVDRADDGVLDSLPGVENQIRRASDYLVALCADFVASTAPPRPSVANFPFLFRVREVLGLTASEWQTVQDALALRLEQDDANFGTDPSVLVDGWINSLVAARAGTPGIVGWDACFLLRTLVQYDYPAAEIAYCRDFIKSLPVDAGLAYGLDSIAHELETLPFAGDTSMNAALRAALLAAARPDGSFPGNPEGGDDQTTAYALLALKAVADPLAPKTAAWLESRIDNRGAIFDPETFVETYEVEGEVLLALLR